MRILLAEDSALMRDGLTAILERAGHHITAAVPDAEALLTTLHQHRDDLPDLVLADVRMPPTNTDDGLRAAITIRERHPQLPVILLSQHLGPEYLERLLDAVQDHPDAGGIGYLLKDRVAHVNDFLTALDTVTRGGILIDQKLMTALRDHRTHAVNTLTDRETEVLRHVAAGATNPQIAAHMHLSEGAIVKHLSNAFDKLGLTHAQGNRRVLAALTYLRLHPQ